VATGVQRSADAGGRRVTNVAAWTSPDRILGDPIGYASTGLIVVVLVVAVRMIICGGSALTGRIGRHSTAGLAVVAAATLVPAQLDQGIGCSHPYLRCERGVVGGPVGKRRPRGLEAAEIPDQGSDTQRNTTADAVIAPVRPRLRAGPARTPGPATLPIAAIPGREPGGPRLPSQATDRDVLTQRARPAATARA
jgi:hypothetical protein